MAAIAVTSAATLGAYAAVSGGGFFGAIGDSFGFGGAPTCRSSRLKTQLFFFEGVPGAVGGVRITNKSSAACSLPTGAPSVSLAVRGQTLAVRQIHVAHPFRAGGEPVVHLLKPGTSAQIDFRWVNWCGRPKLSNFPRDFPTLRFQFRGGAVVSVRFGPKPGCATPGVLSTITATEPLRD